jgi:hypothetical protein
MASYVIMEPLPGASGQIARDPVFIRDGFALLAFLVPLIWLLWHRLWIEAALVLGVTLLLGGLGEYGGAGLLATLLSILVSVYVGLEGAALRIAALRRRGWRDAGVVEADSVADAETRYFAEPVVERPDVVEWPAPAAGSQPPLRTAPSGPALGLFSYPGGR